jgi:PKD domain
MARRLWMILLPSLAALALAAPADADSTSEYGEVLRFGGFDSSSYNSGQYGGPLTPGRLLDPTGFAVDPQDNTVYIVDRTSSYKHNPTSWRIQELSPGGVLGTAGTVLGTTTFTLANGNFGAYAIAGLAVDHRAGRLYALVIGPPPPFSPNNLMPVTQELLAWSTTPDGSRALLAAPGLASDPLHTTGGLVSSATQLRSGRTPLFGPQGVAIDPLESPGQDNPVVIEASDLSENGNGNPVIGDTIVQQVATDGQHTGDLLGSWSGASLTGELGASWGPDGMSTNPDGTITALLDASNLSATNAYVVRLNADLTHPVVLNSDAIEPPNIDLDQAPLLIDKAPFASVAGVGISDMAGAGPEVIQLSSTVANRTVGPYAAIFFSDNNLDHQVGPTATPVPEYWVSRETEANLGVRLLRPAADGTIVDPQGNTIVNTLGNGAVGGACNIGAPAAALASGAAGTLWILDRGPKADVPKSTGQGREIVELVPGAGHLCPQPSGTFTMTPDGGSSQSGAETLKISAGTQVTFDASPIKRQEGKPFAYEWDLDGNATNGPKHDGFETVNEMQSPEYIYPPPIATYKYTQPGRYTVRARFRSDYGVYMMPPATVIVTGPAHPQASFTVISPPGSQQATFDASGSTAGIGTIVNYHWRWGDGSEEDEGPGAPVLTHTYAQPGSYVVTLTVTNSAYQSGTSAPQTVVVEASRSPTPELVSSLTGPLYAIPPAPLYAIPVPPRGALLHLVAHARFARGRLAVKLSCPTAKVSCTGAVRVETAAALAARGRHQGKHRASRLLLGSAPFTVAGGGHATVSVRLSAQGMALLKRVKHLSALVIVSAHDALGDPGSASLRLTLSLAAHVHR